MLPVISSAVFGHFPSPGQLHLLKHFRFLHLYADLDGVPKRLSAVAVRERVDQAGLRVPAVHLPRALADESDDARDALDFAQTLGARLVVAHLPPDEAAIAKLCELATERGIIVAVEIDAVEGATAHSLAHALDSLGAEHGRHGLCLDTSRLRPDAQTLARIRPRLRWLEVSGRTAYRFHAPPAMDDDELRSLVEQLSPNLVCYEVIASGAPGDAEVLSLLSDINLWHRGGGQTTFEHPVVP